MRIKVLLILSVCAGEIFCDPPDPIRSAELEFLSREFSLNLKAEYQNVLHKEVKEPLKREVNKKISDFENLMQNRLSVEKRGVRTKRELDNLLGVNQELDVHILNGFEDRGSIPVHFAKDICVFEIESRLHAVALAYESESATNETKLFFYVQNNNTFEKYLEHKTIAAQVIDCVTYRSAAYVAVTNQMPKNVADSPMTASLIYRITGSQEITVIQYLPSMQLKLIKLWTYSDRLYMMKAFYRPQLLRGVDNATEFLCPVYRFIKYHFDIVAELPCNNVRNIEPFVIRSDMYVAIANYMDVFGSTKTFSYIYKYNVDEDKFIKFQSLSSNGAVDIKHFYFEQDRVREDFLAIANSIDTDIDGSKYPEALSTIYKFIGGQFIPFHTLEFYKVQQFLPVPGTKNEFSLLVACKNQVIQVFQYDGWKFRKALAINTGDAFGKGISRMRTAVINGTTVVTIANTKLFYDHVNIWQPKYTHKNYLKSMHSSMLEWCESSLERISTQRVQILMDRMAGLPKTTDVQPLVFTNGVEFQNATVNDLRVNTLSTQTVIMDAEFFESINDVNENVRKLQSEYQKYESPIVQMRPNNSSIFAYEDVFHNTDDPRQFGPWTDEIGSTSDDPDIIVKDIIISGDFNAKMINNQPFTSLMLTTDNMEIDNLRADTIIAENGLHVENTINGVKFDARNVLLKSGDQILDGDLSINSLNVQNLTVDKINDVPLRSSQHSLLQTAQNLRVKNLHVNGLINGVRLEDLDKNALKLVGDQFIEAPVFINNLITNDFTTNSTISEIELSELVQITAGEQFFIDQDIHFAHGLDVKYLHVDERINNVNIIDGEFDVVMCDTPKLQAIRGDIIFETVELLEEIGLQGKIMKSKKIETMNPIVSINEDVILHGNYFISGNVTVKNFIQATELHGKNPRITVGYLQSHGLLLNSPTSAIDFNFVQPVQSKHCNASSINGLNASGFIKTDFHPAQIIRGRKTFTGDLTINGFCDAKVINDVDLGILNDTVLKRSGEQEVKGTIRIKTISANRARGHIVSLGESASLADILARSNQKSSTISGKHLTVKGNVKIKNSLFIKNLQTDNKLFGINPNEIYDDSAKPNEVLNITGNKFFDTELTIINLILNGNLNKDKKSEEFIGDPSDPCVIKSSIIFHNEMQVNRLIFKGAINGVPNYEFGNSWLLKEFDQNFTAPQVINAVDFTGNLIMSGKLGGFNMTELLGRCYWLDNEEYIENAIFYKTIWSDQIQLGGLFNGFKTSDFILKKSPHTQYIHGLNSKHMIYITGQTFLEDTINSLRVANVRDFCGTTAAYDQRLIINGTCNFKIVPEVYYLNGRHVQEFHANAWLSNGNYTIYNASKFHDVMFENHLYSEGLINGIIYNHFATEYFSLSKMQSVGTPLRVKGYVEFSNIISVNHVLHDGLIKGVHGDKGISIFDLQYNSLHKSEHQKITGKWNMREVRISGHLDGIKINGLNMAADIIKSDGLQHNITGLKSFNNLIVRNLVCTEPCLLENTSIFKWINRFVFRDQENTIDGKLTVNRIKIGRLVTKNPINGIRFGNKDLLTKSTEQVINSNVEIIQSGRLSSTIHFENLNVKTINSKSVKFLEDLVSRTNGSTDVETQVNFIQPVIIADLNFDGEIFGVNASNMMQSKTDVEYEKMQREIQVLYPISRKLDFSYKNYAFYLDHFVLRTILDHDITDIISLKSDKPDVNQNFKDITVVSKIGHPYNSVHFLYYRPEEKKFAYDKSMEIVEDANITIVGISSVPGIIGCDYFALQYFNKTTDTFNQLLLRYNPAKGEIEDEYRFASTEVRNILSMKIASNDCLAFYSPKTNNMQLKCLEFIRSGLEIPGGFSFIQEILTDPVEQAITVQNSIVFLTTANHIKILDLSELNNSAKTLPAINPIWITGLTFDKFNFIAAITDRMNNSLYYGTIEIYRSKANTTSYHLYERIDVKLPKQIELSILPSSELVLYVMTNDPTLPFIVYLHSGLDGFKRFTVMPNIPVGQGFSVMKNYEYRKELIAIKTQKGVFAIEAFINH